MAEAAEYDYAPAIGIGFLHDYSLEKEQGALRAPLFDGAGQEPNTYDGYIYNSQCCIIL